MDINFYLESVIYVYRIGDFLCSFEYENGMQDVLVKLSKPFYTPIVQTSINLLDCPNEQAQKDYLVNNFERLLNTYKNLL